jgi:hypothetical protein
VQRGADQRHEIERAETQNDDRHEDTPPESRPGVLRVLLDAPKMLDASGPDASRASGVRHEPRQLREIRQHRVLYVRPHHEVTSLNDRKPGASEQRLALMRPLSLATIFAGISGSVLGVVNVFLFMGRNEPPTFSHVAAIGISEALVPIFFGFGCLTVAWLSVALGLWRRP